MAHRRGFRSYWLLLEDGFRVHVFRCKENAATAADEHGWTWAGETNKSEYLFPLGVKLGDFVEDA